MVEDFIERRHGRRPITYEVPALEAILRPTYGVIVFQEQVMQIATTLAGFTPGGADLLRRAMGKKKAEVMAEQRDSFVRGAVQNGYQEEQAARIFDLMAYFAGYGFNRSHSVAYALIAYHTAYLKAHFPREFMAALISSDMDNTDKVIRFIGDCRDLGIQVLAPDINTSAYGFTVSGDSIRFGLGAIKGIGQSAIESIVQERQCGGPFSSFFALCERLDCRQVNKKVVESLIKGGALDALELSRSQLFGNMARVLEWAQRQHTDRQQGQISLFGGSVAQSTSMVPTLDQVPEWSESERLTYEKEALGFYISSHPLLAAQHELRRLITVTSQELTDYHGEPTVTLGGIVTQHRAQLTKNGDRMAFLTLEDLHGSFEVIAFPEVYRQSITYCESEEALIIWGKVEGDGSEGRLIAQRILPLKDAIALGEFQRLTLNVSPGLERVALLHLRDLLAASPGTCNVVLAVHFPDGERVRLRAADQLSVTPSTTLLTGLEAVLGVENVRVA
jgi:DNA polymerase-3 subunit alpha